MNLSFSPFFLVWFARATPDSKASGGAQLRTARNNPVDVVGFKGQTWPGATGPAALTKNAILREGL